MKKAIYFLLYLTTILGITCYKGIAQNFDRLQTIGNTGDEAFNTIVVDESGNYYITGRFSGAVDFGEGETRENDNTNEDAFFAKYTPAGKLAFVRHLKSSVRSNGASIRIDKKGNIYVSGVYQKDLSFEGMGRIFTNPLGNSEGNHDLFIAKYKPDGSLVFARKIGGPGNDGSPFFDVDENENVYLAGKYEESVSFFSSSNQKEVTINGLGSEIFLTTYDINGKRGFVKEIKGSRNDNISALGLDGQNNIYITGNTLSKDFDLNADATPDLVADSTDIFIAKFKKDGSYIIAKQIGGPLAERVSGMQVSAAGEVYLTGEADEGADFDPDPVKVVQKVNNLNDIFIAKYLSVSNNLEFAFAQSFGSTDESERGNDITVDKEGKIYITGYFASPALDLNGAKLLTNAGSQDGFWAIFDAKAEQLLFSGHIRSTEDDQGKDIVVDPLGNIYIAGDFRNDATFESRVTKKSNGQRDIFILKYIPGFTLSQPIANLPKGGTHLHATDLDGDGAVDVIAANLGTPSSITWYKNDGTGQFTAQPVVADNIKIPRTVFGADMDNDGDRDILAALRDDNKIVWYENKGGSFAKNSPKIISDVLSAPRSVYPTDLDGDGDLDVLAAFVGNVKITWFENRLNEATHDFVPLPIDGTTTNAEWIFAADLDGDGDPDVLTAYPEANGKIIWHENEEIDASTRKFTLRQETPLANTEFVSAASLNNDDKLEVIGVSKDKISIFDIDESGKFNMLQELGVIKDDGAVSIADLDGDSDLDIVFSSFGDSKVAWYKNDGNGKFDDQQIITQQATGTRAVLTPDLNDDGRPDVLWGAENKNEIAWAKNQLFTPVNPSITTFNPASALPGTTITIYGTNFGNAPIVTFEYGKIPVQATEITPDNSGGKQKLVVKIPETLPKGAYQIKVSNAGKVGVSIDNLLVPVPPAPQVTTLNPPAGPKETILTITGKNFGSDAAKVQVKFGATAPVQVIPAWLKSSTEIVVPVPDIPANTYPVSVVVNGNESNKDKTFIVESVGTPVIYSLSAKSGAPDSKVTITGQFFGTDNSMVSVTFNETPAVFTLKSDTEIEVTVPDLPGALYKIKVTKSGMASNEVDFTISGGPGVPLLSNIDPDTIKANDTPPLKITGTSFGDNKDDITVSFKDINDVPTSVNTGINVNGGTEITFTAPALIVGTYTVSVTVGAIPSNNTLAFTVENSVPNPPEISGFPPFAKAQGEIEITGNHFGTAANNNTVIFSGNGLSEAGDVVSIVNDKIVVKVPDNLTEGEYNITVNVSGSSVTPPNKIAIDNTKPTITAPGEIPESEYFVPGTEKVFTITVADEKSGVSVVNLRYFGIREEAASAKSAPFNKDSGDTYKIDIQSLSIADKLGMEYYFEATDSAGNLAIFPDANHLYLHNDQQSINIQAAKAKKPDQPTTSDYNLVAVPLEDMTRDQVFKSLGTFGEESDWWLFAYNADSQGYTEVTSPSAALDPGKGYMLIFRGNAASIPPLQGKVVSVTTKKPVTITLAPMFNVIGNPFPFDLDWGDIVAFNTNVQGVNDLVFHKFNRAGGNYNDTNTSFNALTGALVTNPTSSEIILTIPYKKADTGGRYAQDEKKNKPQPLDAIAWEVPLRVETGDRFTLGGFGMHQRAATGYDPLDDFTVPRFIDYLELNSYHAEFFIPKFAKDIVPTQDAYVWEFEVASNLESPEVTIHWENHYFGDNRQALMLLDLQSHQIIDMREATAYTFSVVEGIRQFKVFFGNEDQVKENMLPEIIAVGEAYPNPMQSQLAIPVSLPNTTRQLSMEIYNITGQLVKRIHYDDLPAGYHRVQWDRTDTDGQKVRSGLYFYRLNVNDALYDGRIIAW